MPVKTSRYCVYCGVLSTSHLGLLNSLSRRKLRFGKNCLHNLLRYRSFTPYPKNLTIFGDPKRHEPCADPRTFNFNSTLNDNKCLRHLVFDRFYIFLRLPVKNFAILRCVKGYALVRFEKSKQHGFARLFLFPETGKQFRGAPLCYQSTLNVMGTLNDSRWIIHHKFLKNL